MGLLDRVRDLRNDFSNFWQSQDNKEKRLWKNLMLFTAMGSSLAIGMIRGIGGSFMAEKMQSESLLYLSLGVMVAGVLGSVGCIGALEARGAGIFNRRD